MPRDVPAPIRLAAAGLSLIAVCYGLARFAYGLFLPVLTDEFGLDGAVAGAIASSSYIGYCVAIVAATAATALWGPRAVAVAAGITAAAGTGLIAAAGGTGVLAVGVVIAGASTGLASPPLADAIARWVTADRADRVQTAVNAGTGLGVMVSGPVALLTGQNWRLAWFVFALTAVVVTIWIAATIPRHDTASDSPRWRALLPARWFPPGSLRLLTAATVMGAGSAAIWTFGRDIAISSGGVSSAASTVLWIILGAAGLLGALTGDLTARVGLASAWSISMLVLAAATATFAFAVSHYPVILVAVAVFGAVYIALTGLMLLWGLRIYPDHPAFGVGAPFFLIAAGQALASPLIGLLSDATTATIAFGVAAAGLAIGAAVRPRAVT
jgi:predicted MFS family arabinose efflux permease